MTTTYVGTVRNGKVEFEPPLSLPEGSQVRITLSKVLRERQTAGKANVWLANLDVTRPQEALAKTPGLNPPFGTGHSNIKKLASTRIKVTYTAAAGDLADIGRWLEQETPVIVLSRGGGF